MNLLHSRLHYDKVTLAVKAVVDGLIESTLWLKGLSKIVQSSGSL